MKQSLFSLMMMCLFFAIGVLHAEEAVAPKVPSAKEYIDKRRLNGIDKLVEQAISREALPSAVCYVAYNGNPLYFKTFGFADPANEKLLKKEAIFRLASQTKLVTTVALMTLYEQGLFSLEDPLKKFLPEFSNPVVYVSGSVAENNLVTRPAYGDITIRQLLSNSSGISYDVYDQNLQQIHYAEQTSTESAVKRIAKLPLKFDPGEGFVDGFGVDVAGRLAEVVSGVRLDSLIKERVLDPLKMENTYFYLPIKKVNKLVPLYQKKERDVPAVQVVDSLDGVYPLAQNQLYFGGGAGLCGTIEDYARLCQMILDQGKVGKAALLSKKTIEQICTDQIFGIQGDFEFGLGLEIATREDFARTMRTPGSLSLNGFFGTHSLIDPQNKLVIILFTNKVSWNVEEDIFGKIQRAVYMSLR